VLVWTFAPFLFAQTQAVTLDPRVMLGVVTLLATVTANFVAVKLGQHEQQRLLQALHSRFDELEKDHIDVRIEAARQDERQKALREEVLNLKRHRGDA